MCIPCASTLGGNDHIVASHISSAYCVELRHSWLMARLGYGTCRACEVILHVMSMRPSVVVVLKITERCFTFLRPVELCCWLLVGMFGVLPVALVSMHADVLDVALASMDVAATFW